MSWACSHLLIFSSLLPRLPAESLFSYERPSNHSVGVHEAVSSSCTTNTVLVVIFSTISQNFSVLTTQMYIFILVWNLKQKELGHPALNWGQTSQSMSCPYEKNIGLSSSWEHLWHLVCLHILTARDRLSNSFSYMHAAQVKSVNVHITRLSSEI